MQMTSLPAASPTPQPPARFGRCWLVGEREIISQPSSAAILTRLFSVVIRHPREERGYVMQVVPVAPIAVTPRAPPLQRRLVGGQRRRIHCNLLLVRAGAPLRRARRPPPSTIAETSASVATAIALMLPITVSHTSSAFARPITQLKKVAGSSQAPPRSAPPLSVKKFPAGLFGHHRFACSPFLSGAGRRHSRVVSGKCRRRASRSYPQKRWISLRRMKMQSSLAAVAAHHVLRKRAAGRRAARAAVEPGRRLLHAVDLDHHHPSRRCRPKASAHLKTPARRSSSSPAAPGRSARGGSAKPAGTGAGAASARSPHTGFRRTARRRHSRPSRRSAR